MNIWLKSLLFLSIVACMQGGMDAATKSSTVKPVYITTLKAALKTMPNELCRLIYSYASIVDTTKNTEAILKAGDTTITHFPIAGFSMNGNKLTVHFFNALTPKELKACCGPDAIPCTQTYQYSAGHLMPQEGRVKGRSLKSTKPFGGASDLVLIPDEAPCESLPLENGCILHVAVINHTPKGGTQFEWWIGKNSEYETKMEK
jgi:hypothetical protein